MEGYYCGWGCERLRAGKDMLRAEAGLSVWLRVKSVRWPVGRGCCSSAVVPASQHKVSVQRLCAVYVRVCARASGCLLIAIP